MNSRMLEKGARLSSFVTILLVVTTHAMASPRIVSLGSGVPNSVTNDISGTYYIGGAGLASTSATRWTVTGTSMTITEIGGSGSGFISMDAAYQTGLFTNAAGPNQVFGYTATGVSPPHSPTPTLVMSTTLPGTSELCAHRWTASSNTWQILGGPNGLTGPLAQNVGLPATPSLLAFGSSSSGGSTSTFISPNAISATGRYVVGLGYACVYNTLGTTISANSFRWRPWIWDAEANGGAGGFTILPTPFRTTSGQTNLRRTGNAYAVSADGQVIVGAQEHNVGTLPNPDPDGGRLVVWRWNSGTNEYDMTFLPNGVNTSGYPYTYSTTPSSVDINMAGTIIVGRAIDDNGFGYLGKWVWNAGTSSWDPPISLGSDLEAPATWLPGAVTSCGLPPTLGGVLATSEDGSVVVGSAVYSTCGSFMSGGFIWHQSDNTIKDWYDYLVSQGSTDAQSYYGPIGDAGDPTRGLPRLGFPTSISPDGTAVVGFQGGTQIIPDAVPTFVDLTGGTACTEPTITVNPVAAYNYSRCSSLGIILSARAAGSAPITYQWRRDGMDLVDGPTGTGSTITGANATQLRITQPNLSDLGTYDCVITGACGSPLTTSSCVVQLDSTIPLPANDTCSTAEVLSTTLPVSVAFNPCHAWVDDGAASCSPSIGDLWYSFTPDATADYRIETCDSSTTTPPNTANYDTVISLYTDCSGSEIACNNDYNTGPTRNCAAVRSRIPRITLQGGVPILIRVAATSSLGTTGFLRVSLAPPPTANDTCFAPITAVDGANVFDLTEATNDSVVGCNANQGRDVWFAYTPTQTGLLTASTCHSTTNLDTVVTAFDSCGGIELGCNDTATPAGTGCSSNRAILRDLSVDAGVTYYIRVASGTVGTMGTSATAIGGTLTLTVTPLAITQQPQDVDVCAGSTADFSVTATGATTYHWRFNGTPLSESADISGSTASTLHVMNVTEDDEGDYDCLVSNDNGLVVLVSDTAHLNVIDSCVIGDMNCDLIVDDDDVALFVAVLLGSAPSEVCNLENADVNGNGSADGADIDPFVRLLIP